MKKEKITRLLAVAVIAVIAVGGTLAYLSSVTETKTNSFASNKAIAIQLREPAWDGYTFADTNPGDGVAAKPGITGDELKALGVTQAAAYVPGQAIPKDPTVRNSGDATNGVDTYVALKVEYIDENGNAVSYETFKSKYLDESGIAFDDRWSLLNTTSETTGQIYLYGGATNAATVLNTGAKTTPLFTSVPLSLDIEPGTDGKLPGFKIKVTAYAVQADNIDASQAGAQLLKFVGEAH